MSKFSPSNHFIFDKEVLVSFFDRLFTSPSSGSVLFSTENKKIKSKVATVVVDMLYVACRLVIYKRESVLEEFDGSVCLFLDLPS